MEMQSILRIHSDYRFDYNNKARNTTDRDRTQSLQPIRQHWKSRTSHTILLLCRQGDVIDDDDAHLKISVRLISTHQVGQKGTPLAVRCAVLLTRGCSQLTCMQVALDSSQQLGDSSLH